MRLYVLCVLGGMALLAVLIGAPFVRKVRAALRWERQRQNGIHLDGPPSQISITNNRVRSWSDPAKKGFQRGGQ